MFTFLLCNVLKKAVYKMFTFAIIKKKKLSLVNEKDHIRLPVIVNVMHRLFKIPHANRYFVPKMI